MSDAVTKHLENHVLTVEVSLPGQQGPATRLAIGTVTSGAAADATLTGPAGDQQLHLTLPQGPKGDPATAADLAALLGATDAGEANALAGALSHTANTAARSGRDQLRAAIGELLSKPMPSLPLPNRSKVLLLGHSFIGRGSYNRYNAAQTATQGLQGHTVTPAAVMAYIAAEDYRFNLDSFASATLADRPPAANQAVTGAQQGINGDRLYPLHSGPGTITRTHYCLERQPAIVYLDVGTNELSGGIGADLSGQSDAASIIGVLTAQIQLFTNANIWVVLQTQAWRFDFSPAQLAELVILNTWIAAQSGRRGVKICDTRTLDGHPDAKGNTDADSLFLPDGVHLTPFGARSRAEILLPILRGMVAPGDGRNLDPLSGNLLPQAGLPGTAGTKGTGITGNLATGFGSVRAAGTSTYVASKQVITPGNERQLITVNPVADGTAIHSLRLTLPDLNLASLGIAAGDWLDILLPVELDDWAGWTYFSTGLGTNATSLMVEQYAGATFVWEDNVLVALPGKAYVLHRKIQVLGNPAATTLRFSIRPITITHRSDVSGTGTVKLGSPIIRKIDDPRAVWQLN